MSTSERSMIPKQKNIIITFGVATFAFFTLTLHTEVSPIAALTVSATMVVLSGLADSYAIRNHLDSKTKSFLVFFASFYMVFFVWSASALAWHFAGNGRIFILSKVVIILIAMLILWRKLLPVSNSKSNRLKGNWRVYHISLTVLLLTTILILEAGLVYREVFNLSKDPTISLVAIITTIVILVIDVTACDRYKLSNMLVAIIGFSWIAHTAIITACVVVIWLDLSPATSPWLAGLVGFAIGILMTIGRWSMVRKPN